METDVDIIFVDSSVLFAACHSKSGYARDLLAAAERGELTLAVSQFVLTETHRNLARKSSTGAKLLTGYQSRGLFVLAEPNQELVDKVSEFIEPKDAPIVAAAIACSAAIIASFDQRHLLQETSTTEEHWSIRVLTPLQILVGDG